MSTFSEQWPRASATSQNVTLPHIPELFNPKFLDVLVPPTEGEAASAPSTAMMDAPRSTARQKLTINAAPASSSQATRVATLDAYLGLRIRDIYTSGKRVEKYLSQAWAMDPELTLRMIWNTRSVHDGNAERWLFYRAFGWLLEMHPRTAISNLHLLVEPVCLRSGRETGKKRPRATHGYWKDLLNILAMATLDELRRKPLRPRSTFLRNYYDGKSRPAFKNNEEQEQWSREQRVKRFEDAHERLSRKLLDDRRFHALYIAVARLFADQLAKDFDTMDKISTLPRDATKKERMDLMYALSLASKWAPTPGGAHDRVTNIASAICLLLHEAQVSSSISHRVSSYRSPTPIDMHLLRSFYQRHVLTRGRSLLCVPERLMTSNRWSEIVYTRLGSGCIRKNKEQFFTHDKERFLNYVDNVESGKKQISGATLLPDVLALEAVRLYWSILYGGGQILRATDAWPKRNARLAKADTQLLHAQWATLMARLRDSGQLDNSIAVCDAPYYWGSVTPISPAVTLSLLVARLAKPPFKDTFTTFSATPKLVTIDPESARVSLAETLMSMNRVHRQEENADINAVFLKLILPLAIKNNVPKDQMIKRIFVFSDISHRVSRVGQFIQAQSVTEWNANHDVIVKAYQEAGYDVPELVYWDVTYPEDELGLRSSRAYRKEVTGDRRGVAMLTGYSSLLKVFMDTDEIATPEELMKQALGRKSFDGLRVVD